MRFDLPLRRTISSPHFSRALARSLILLFSPHDILGLRASRSGLDVKLNLFAFAERSISLFLNRAVMDENVGA